MFILRKISTLQSVIDFMFRETAKQRPCRGETKGSQHYESLSLDVFVDLIGRELRGAGTTRAVVSTKKKLFLTM
jgi:hypothetical protein